MLKHAVLVAVLATGTWQVAADDLVPPGWTRPTQKGTETGWPAPANATHSIWDTLGPTGPIQSDYSAWGANVVPTPAYPVVPAPNGEFTGRSFTHNYWAPGTISPVGRDGVAELSGDLNFLIPNTPEQHNWHKYMQVQITWKPETPGDVPALHADTVGGHAVTDADWTKNTITLTDGWMHTTYDAIGFYDLAHNDLFNPLGEQFTVSGNVYVDQVVIDTVCIPEPSQVAMGAMFALFGVGYAWRRVRLTK